MQIKITFKKNPLQGIRENSEINYGFDSVNETVLTKEKCGMVGGGGRYKNSDHVKKEKNTESRVYITNYHNIITFNSKHFYKVDPENRIYM